MFTTLQEARAAWQADRARLIAAGISFENGWEPRSYLPEEFRFNDLAFDAAQPTLSTGQSNSAVPALLTTLVDPTVYEVLFSPSKGADILGEVRKGTWVDQTALFPTVEHVGEVTTYGDYNEGGHANANTWWPQRQSYLFQTKKEYGELELERAGLARINWVSEVDKAAALALTKYLNLTYFFGVNGLQNYGLTNDPQLTSYLTPGLKANGGTGWIVNNAINATANEVYLDIEALFLKLVNQTQGLIKRDAPMTLAMSPQSEVALTATNAFGVNVGDLLKKNFPNIKIETAVQYGVLNASNPQGISAGSVVQLIVRSVEGQESGYCAFNEKMRTHKIIPAMSSFKQKVTCGTWGAIIRQPFAIAQMLGV